MKLYHCSILFWNIIFTQINEYLYLQKLGLEFPRRSPDAAPILTPPITRPTSLESYHQPSYGMPVNSSSRFDEAMPSNGPSLR